MAKKSAIAEYAADMDIAAVTSEGNDGEQVIAELEVYISESTKLEMQVGAEVLKKHAEYAAAAAQAAEAEAAAE